MTVCRGAFADAGEAAELGEQLGYAADAAVAVGQQVETLEGLVAPWTARRLHRHQPGTNERWSGPLLPRRVPQLTIAGPHPGWRARVGCANICSVTSQGHPYAIFRRALERLVAIR